MSEALQAEERRGIAEMLRAEIIADAGEWDSDTFEEMALALFRHQYKHMAPYRRLCDSRGATPDRIDRSRDIPPVPTSMYKSIPLFAGPESDVAQVFTTSGTTGADRKGESRFSKDGLDLMERSIVVNARRMLFPDIERLRILVLAPPPALAPRMIMAWGMERLIRRFGTDGSRFMVGPHGLDVPGLFADLRECQEKGLPVALIGASFGFVNLVDGMRAKGVSFKLPAGSRTLDAGGYKGKSKELTRAELEGAMSEAFGVAEGYTVNLLGMTELASQIYDDTLFEATRARTGESSGQTGSGSGGRKAPPPWVRTRVVDPVTLKDLAPGEKGVLLHLDLANLDTPMAVLTDDVGILRSVVGAPECDVRFEVLGRLTADDSRGCSLTVDEMTRGRT